MDMLDVQPLAPGHRTQRLTGEIMPEFDIVDGVLRGPGTMHCPTGTKFYNRPDGFQNYPAAVVQHFTACHASVRPLVDFDKLVNLAGDRLDNCDGAIDALYVKVVRLGFIPDALSLTLQNATKERNSSWCLCVGSIPLPSGELPVVQYSPHLGYFGTMNAGSPATWKARKKYGNKPFLTTRGEVRWDGRDYAWPVVTDSDGNKRTLDNVNAFCVGVELMNFGPMNLVKRLRYPMTPTVQIDGRWYEQPSDLMVATWQGIVRALRRAYRPDLPVYQHRDLVPHKIDAVPPFPLT